MKKPQMKREVAIDIPSRIVGKIYFYSTADAVTEFEKFGKIYRMRDVIDEEHIYSFSEDYYVLTVDPRFDFDEVVQYMEGYGSE